MPGLRERHQPDLVIVNGENSAGGLGITEKTASEHLRRGRRRDHDRQPRLPPPRRLRVTSTASERVIRPANYPHVEPGPRAHDRRGGRQAGRRDQPQRRDRLRVARSPFPEADALLERLEGEADA